MLNCRMNITILDGVTMLPGSQSSVHMRERVIVVALSVCYYVVQHGILKTADCYPFKQILS